MADNIVTVGLLLRLEAAPGRENNIQSLPEEGDLDGERGAEGHGVVRGPLRSLNVRHLRRLPDERAARFASRAGSLRR